MEIKYIMNPENGNKSMLCVFPLSKLCLAGNMLPCVHMRPLKRVNLIQVNGFHKQSGRKNKGQQNGNRKLKTWDGRQQQVTV